MCFLLRKDAQFYGPAQNMQGLFYEQGGEWCSALVVSGQFRMFQDGRGWLIENGAAMQFDRILGKAVRTTLGMRLCPTTPPMSKSLPVANIGAGKVPMKSSPRSPPPCNRA